MRQDRIIMAPPALNEHLSLLERRELLPLQWFVPEL